MCCGGGKQRIRQTPEERAAAKAKQLENAQRAALARRELRAKIAERAAAIKAAKRVQAAGTG